LAATLGDEGLSASRYATLVLRFLLDPRGRMVQGTLINVESGQQVSFRGWRGLAAVLKDWRSGTSSEGAEH
jgi:hypothetical protein